MSRHDISSILTKYAQARVKRAQQGAEAFIGKGLHEGTEYSVVPGSPWAALAGVLGGYGAGRGAETYANRLMTNLKFDRSISQGFNREPMSTALAPLPGGSPDVVAQRINALTGANPVNTNTSSVTTYSQGQPTTAQVLTQDPGTQTTGERLAEMFRGSRPDAPASSAPRIDRVRVDNVSTSPGEKDKVKPSRATANILLDEPAGGRTWRQMISPLRFNVNTVDPSSYSTVLGRTGARLTRGIPAAAAVAGGMAALKATEGQGPVQFTPPSY